MEVRRAMLESRMATVLVVVQQLVAQITEKAVADSTAKHDAMIEDLRAVAGGTANGSVWSTSLSAKTPCSDIAKT